MTAALAATAAGCGAAAHGATAAGSVVRVLYAGSLANVMERHLGPTYERLTNDRFEGYGSDSLAVANSIKDGVKAGDVFVSASPAADQALAGKRNGDWVRWWATFATSELVLAYHPQSRFAAAFRSRPWYDVLRRGGLRLGMTDPRLDPKGQLSVMALRDAGRREHLGADFAATLTKRANVFPEPELLGRLESGQLDAAFFYRDEALPAHLPVVSLGPSSQVAHLTLTLLERAPDPAAGTAFIRYLLTSARPALAAQGLHLVHPVLAGDPRAVPPSLHALLRR